MTSFCWLRYGIEIVRCVLQCWCSFVWFDVVSHHLFLDKLRLLGICSPLIEWIADFLIGRVRRVSDIRSFKDVRTRLQQGSMLSPLLFLPFVDHLPTNVVSKCNFFLWMIKIYLKVRHINIVNIYLVVKEIYTIVHVALSWGLEQHFSWKMLR